MGLIPIALTLAGLPNIGENRHIKEKHDIISMKFTCQYLCKRIDHSKVLQTSIIVVRHDSFIVYQNNFSIFS